VLSAEVTPPVDFHLVTLMTLAVPAHQEHHKGGHAHHCSQTTPTNPAECRTLSLDNCTEQYSVNINQPKAGAPTSQQQLSTGIRPAVPTEGDTRASV
jgi:hypothetical protein